MALVSRRKFLIGAGALASVSMGLEPSWGDALPIDGIKSFVDTERESIQRLIGDRTIEGISVCLVYRGQPVWTEGFGVATEGAGAVATDTIFSLQSTSKNVTAVAILLAVQSGLLDLDEPIAKYLPRFTVRSRFEGKPEDQITLRLLLSHRAGFTHEAPVGNNYEPESRSFESHVESISQTWLRYPVGERYRYSNLGYDLAGYILQVKTGVPFAAWVEKAVFGPLGMKDATFSSDVYESRKNRAVGHLKGYSSVPLRTPLIPSGGAYVSANDMIRYSSFHLGRGSVDGKTVLKRELWDEMHGFALGGDYGLGTIRTEASYGPTPLRILGHKGGGFGFGSVFVYCPEAELAWTAVFNRSIGAGYGLGATLIDSILGKRYGARRARTPVDELAQLQPTAPQLDALVGTYIGRNRNVTVTANGHSLSMYENGSAVPITFQTPDQLFVPDDIRDAVTFQVVERTATQPLHLEYFEGELSLDYNEGPHDAPGPNRPEWKPFTGNYVVRQWGKNSMTVAVEIHKGYLTVNGIRSVESTEPGLFFTADGEAVDFRSKPATWRSLLLQRT